MKILTLLFALCGVAAYAQTSTSTTIPKLNVVPSSAEASHFARYGETPVSLYTGVPNISIPIYTIDLKGIKLPVSLSYYAGGIKVDEIASNVGLGWSLNFGGSITANVNGIPDKEANGWLNVPSIYRLPQTGSLQTQWGAFDTYLTDPKYDFMNEVAADHYDTQPDLYYANINGKSFKYFYEQDGTIHTMPYQNVRILDGIEITDENDNIFQFIGSDLTTTNYQYYGGLSADGSPPSHQSNAMYPGKITTPFQEEVNYTYETYNYSFKNQASETRYSRYPNQFGCAGVMPNNTLTESTSQVAASRIKKITATNGVEINFYYAQSRTDLPGSAALTSIVIKNINTNVVLASYTFTYSYYISITGSIDPDAYRLRLESVQKAGENPYYFQYNESQLPVRLSKSQDHWGFFNNAENSTLLPADTFIGFPSGANREPSALVAQNGILTKITYPTGGSSEFEYESNSVASSTAASSGYVQRSAGAYESIDSTMVVPFTIGASPMNFTVKYKSPYGGDPETGLVCDNCPVQIRNANHQLVYSFSGQSAPQGNVLAALSSGNYFLEIPYVGLTTEGFIEVFWSEYQAQPAVEINKIVGGLRIKKITDNPLIGVSKKTFYNYDRSDGSGITTGVSGVTPKYDYIHTLETLNGDSQVNSDCLFYAQSTSSLSPIGRVQGGTVAYGQVGVYVEDQHKGYTLNKFSYAGDISGSWEFPFGAVISNDWIDGLPLETKEFAWNEQQGKYFPVKRTVNTYKTTFGPNSGYPHEYAVRGAKVALYKPAIPPSFPATGPSPRGPEFKVNYFNLYSSWSFPMSKIEVLYDQADTTKTITTSYQYFYDNPAHIQLTRQLSSKSSGQQTLVSLRYPKDINSSFSYYSNPVVEKKIFVKNGSTVKLIDGELTTYKNQAGIFPEYYYDLTLAQPVDSASFPSYNGSSIPTAYEQRLAYNYDANNNIISVVNDQNKTQGFKWGYKGTLVLAAAINALENEFYYEGFEETGVAGNAHTGNKASNGAYTVSWTKPNNRNYIISYWYLDGVWKFREQPYVTNSLALTLGTVYDDIRIYPVDAQVTSYTYQPLVGMTSMTDAKGMITTYEYDAFQRLKAIKDQNGNILKQTDYHYKN
ncbi:YD repeat-containing protein [Pedobacter sp. AK013]|uniref:RHS repeat domain-containing protein n=1 Tax=Pedobacter sp. AK013 TaxID=2723071 RepID=UPI00160D7B01|nr:RHS repeat domain-containing protein [Pedobacter sp. AK013]MBB6239889.1 YD repeat-containing protein [Pedobacter sp. AK013]